MARYRLMEPQEKAIYVAVDNDREEGLKTLRWTLQKWRSHQISIIILHMDINSKDTVKTYYGTMPSSFVNEEMLEVLRKKEQEKIDDLLSLYKAMCGKMKVEILKVEKCDKPTREHIIDLIYGLNITYLVMGLTFLKPSSRRSKSAISGCFYIHQNKPEFCEFFIISGGKQVLISEDLDRGALLSPSSSNPESPSFENQWESYAEEIQNYLQHLLSLNLDDENYKQESNNNNSSMEAEMKELRNFITGVADKSEYLRTKIKELNEKIQSKIDEKKSNSDRLAKAEWTISFCNRRAVELETLITKRVANRVELNKELDTTRDFLHKTLIDIEEKNKELRLLLGLQSELSEKLRSIEASRSQVEEDLKKATIERSKNIDEIKELKRQTSVVRQRIEFCKERDKFGKVEEVKCELREFSGDEIRSATEDFLERLRIKSGGDWSCVYKGRLYLNKAVAFKIFDSIAISEEDDFRLKVKFLSHIRHPHVVAMVGFCCEPKCIVFEYMHNGSLRDILLSSSRSSTKTDPVLPWHSRVHIAAQLCSALCYLHLARPKPIVHGRLSASDVLLDQNLVAKIGWFGLGPCHDEAQMGSDVKAFGVLLMQLLTGSNWAGLVDEATLMDKTGLGPVLDETAGEWPLDLAEGLALLAFKCLTTITNLKVEMVMEELEEFRKKSDVLVDRRGLGVIIGGEQRHGFVEVPSIFICPIYQDVMENPHVAADGFSYEVEAIEEWLKMGRDTSPMTNLKLKHKFLTPNHSLYSLIQDWNNNNRSTIIPP